MSVPKRVHPATTGLLIALALSGLASRAAAQDRMPPVAAEQLTDEQKKAAAVVAPKGNLPVYLVPFLRSPEVMTRVAALGDYVVRGKTALNLVQTELVILLVVRHWSQDYMWSNHYQVALKAGLPAEAAAAIGAGRRPDRLSDDQQVLYEFVTELLRTQRVSDATYRRMVVSFGEAGVIDALGLAGYYTMLAMTYNTTRMPPTPGGASLPAMVR